MRSVCVQPPRWLELRRTATGQLVSTLRHSPHRHPSYVAAAEYTPAFQRPLVQACTQEQQLSFSQPCQQQQQQRKSWQQSSYPSPSHASSSSNSSNSSKSPGSQAATTTTAAAPRVWTGTALEKKIVNLFDTALFQHSITTTFLRNIVPGSHQPIVPLLLHQAAKAHMEQHLPANCLPDHWSSMLSLDELWQHFSAPTSLLQNVMAWRVCDAWRVATAITIALNFPRAAQPGWTAVARVYGKRAFGQRAVAARPDAWQPASQLATLSCMLQVTGGLYMQKAVVMTSPAAGLGPAVQPSTYKKQRRNRKPAAILTMCFKQVMSLVTCSNKRYLRWKG